MVAQYIDIAERFRARLRTDEFPVGATVSAVRTLCHDYGVSSATAYRALKHLEALGELRTVHGSETTVLPKPPAGTPEPMDLLAETRTCLARASTLLAELAKQLSKVDHDRGRRP